MKILVTGATGYVGRRVAEKLAAKGHEVTGSVRSLARADALPAGVQPTVLDFADPEGWGKAAADMEAVVHTAFAHHDADWGRAVAQEHAVVAALVRALDRADRTLIVSNGTLFLGDSREARLSEDAPVPADHPAAIRAAATVQVRAAGLKLRAIEIRLASFVYGHGGSVFLPVLLAAAKRDGRSIYPEAGLARTSAVHVDAAADAYVAALERGRAGAIYHVASEEEPTIREVAEAIAMAAGGVPSVSVPIDEAASALDPFTAMFLTVNNRLDASRAHDELGWRHVGYPTLVEDVARGSYANVAASTIAA
jgi:nucleoside-diphosphate-sugar epimerase